MKTKLQNAKGKIGLNENTVRDIRKIIEKQLSE